jgi:hypothetical protein
VGQQHLAAPAPALLLDHDYAAGYRQQANHIKRKRAWAGYGTGAVIQVLLLGLLATSAMP